MERLLFQNHLLSVHNVQACGQTLHVVGLAEKCAAHAIDTLYGLVFLVGNDVINDFLGYLTSDDADRMEILLNGGTVDIPVSETMSYQELKNRKSNDFWSLLLYTGYLTSVSKKAGGDSDSLAPVIGASPPFFPPFRLFGGMPSHITYTPFPSFSYFIPVLPLLRPPFLKKNVFRMLFFCEDAGNC